jgi:phenylacetate-CoA ligase
LRQRLQEKLGMEIRQAYGTVFLGCLGYECSLARGLHVPDNVLVEVVDPATGKAAPKGVVGEIVATTFDRVYPLVRLATGDLSLWAKEPCACGRTSGILGKVLGRVDQATKVRGTFLHPWQTDEIAAKYPEIFKYQVIITRKDHKDHLSMVVEVADDHPQKDILKARLERDIKDLLTIKGEARVVRQGSIPDFHKKIDDKRTWE